MNYIPACRLLPAGMLLLVTIILTACGDDYNSARRAADRKNVESMPAPNAPEPVTPNVTDTYQRPFSDSMRTDSRR